MGAEKKNGEGKEGKYFEREKYVFFADEKKNREGKGGKYLVRKISFFYGGEETLPNKCTTDPDGGLSSSCLSNL